MVPTRSHDDEVRGLWLFTVKRLSLWLAVGNAGGLLAMGSQAVQFIDKPIAALLVPSLWFFAFGLVGSFVLQIPLSITLASDRDVDDRVAIPGSISLIVAAGGALAGIFYPLTVASFAMFRFGIAS